MRVLVRWLLVASIFALATPALAAERAARGPSEQDRGESAAKAFLQGKYEDALATYLDLYVTTARPEYLRNIARCQQQLRQYDRAIENFKEYLRRAGKLRAAEKTEIERYIADTEAARAKERDAATPPASKPEPAPAPPPPASSAEVRPPATSVPPPAAAPPGPPPPDLGASASAAPPPPLSSPTTPAPAGAPASADGSVLIATKPAAVPTSRWRPRKTIGLVAMITGVVLVGGATAALFASRSTYDSAKSIGCPTKSAASCSDKADSVSTLNTVSEILYVAGGVAALGGATLFLVPTGSATASDARVGMALHVSF